VVSLRDFQRLFLIEADVEMFYNCGTSYFPLGHEVNEIDSALYQEALMQT
jgi:hypothetical protein